MTPGASAAWAPSPGRHHTNIGTSLGRALRARKGNGAPPPAKRNNLPERELYSLRYGFKPSTIDSTKPGSLDVQRSSDNSPSTVTVEHPSSQPGEVYVFPGKEGPNKEWVCVLIYDEATGDYTLEKLESSFALARPEKRAGTARPSHSPPAQTPDYATPSASSNSHANPPDADFEEILPSSLLPGSSKSSRPAVNDDDDDIPLKSQVAATPLPKKPSPQKPLPQKSRAPAPSANIPAPAPVKPSTSKPAPKSKKTAKRATPTFSDVEEEHIEVQRPTKRTKPSPPPAPEPKRAPSPPRLELPGMPHSVVAPLPMPPGQPTIPTAPPPQASTSTATSNSLAPLILPTNYDSEEEDEDWEQVAAPVIPHPAPAPPTLTPMVEDEGGEEIDLNEFTALMDAQFDDDEQEQEQEREQDPDQDHDQDPLFPDDDFLAAAIPEEATPVISKGPPMSLKQFLGGDDSDDESSSSDDSDDD